MKEIFNVNFYHDDIEISRKTYRCSYGQMIRFARERAIKIDADYFWHIKYLRKFEINKEED